MVFPLKIRSCAKGIGAAFLGLLVSACASDFSSEKKTKAQSKPVVGEIQTKTKFKAGKRFGEASERVVRSALAPVPRGGGRAVVGKPYKINGRWYRPRKQPNYDQTGVASWYGPNFHGRKTANGEIYDQTHLSAAHPTLPLPSYVKVTNLSNKRSVTVRVNDRGPFVKNRLIDLSYRTAELLGTRAGGLAKVRVQYIGPAPVDGDDEEYLAASYKGPGSVQPSKLAARKKLLTFAGLPDDDALIAQALNEELEPNQAEETVTTPQIVVASNVEANNNSASGQIQTPRVPKVIANRSGDAFKNGISESLADSGPLVLQPRALTPVVQNGVGRGQVAVPPSTSRQSFAGNAYAPTQVDHHHISRVFDQLVVSSQPPSIAPKVITVGVFQDKEEAMKLVDQLSHLGEVSLSTQLLQGVPSTRISLLSNSPFSLKAVQQLVPGAVFQR